MAPASVALVDAWMAWDRWARQLRQSKYRTSARSGQQVTNRLVDLEVEVANHLGISSGELHTEVVAGLRAGLSVTDAVERLLRRGERVPADGKSEERQAEGD